MAGSRSKGLTRKTGINLVPILIYVAVAVVVTAGMVVWDLQYRRAEEARRRPPEPEVIARNLVENVVGAGTVKEVSVNRDKKTITLSFEATQFKPGKSRQELRELLEAEALLATQSVLQQMRDYGQVTATLIHQGKTLAVAVAVQGREEVAMTFVDERLKE